MELTRTRAYLPRVEWRDSSPSTNAELRELAETAARIGQPLPHGTLLVTDSQTAGRGRLDRGWVTPAGTALAASVLVRGFGERRDDSVPPVWGELGPAWLPLIAGSAVQAALQPLFREEPDTGAAKRVGVKWPNDVHVRDEADAIAGRPGKKLCGILCELLPDGSAIVGMGMNLLIPEWELPTDRATSLLAAGADVGAARSGELGGADAHGFDDHGEGDAFDTELTFADAAGADLADRVLEAVTAELLRLATVAGEEPQAIRARAARHSLTLGTEVRVHLPDESVVDGRARALADDGSLIVDLPTGGQLTVSAGDVQHLR